MDITYKCYSNNNFVNSSSDVHFIWEQKENSVGNFRTLTVFISNMISIGFAVSIVINLLDKFKPGLGSAVAQCLSAWLETKGPWIWASPASLCWALEQEH